MSQPLEYQVPEMGRIRRIHFVGIGGAGMCGIAEVLINQGYQVSGSDAQSSDTTVRLQAKGAQIFYGHAASQVADVDVVVTSTAISDDNVEVVAAVGARIPVVPRAEMLGELMRYRHGIAVAGAHGKTTTTSLVTEIFRRAGQSPTFVIGGLLHSAGANAELGSGRYLVAEADESDASFLHLQPMTAVITNIDHDHMSTYGNDFSKLKDAFVQFAHCLPFYGTVIVCADDAEVMDIVPRLSRRVITYGIHQQADFRAIEITTQVEGWQFQVRRPRHEKNLCITLAVPGMHNVLNALAAIAVATDEGLTDIAIVEGLQGFQGVERRFQIDNDIVVGSHQLTLVDDYGHHPTEVAAVIDTARRVWPERRLAMVYQPHRFSRTQDLFEDFVRVLSTVDALLLLDVYGAGEKPIPGADGPALSQAIRQRGGVSPVFAQDANEALGLLEAFCQQDDILVVQGAGNVSAVSRGLRSEDV